MPAQEVSKTNCNTRLGECQWTTHHAVGGGSRSAPDWTAHPVFQSKTRHAESLDNFPKTCYSGHPEIVRTLCDDAGDRDQNRIHKGFMRETDRDTER